MAIIQAVQFKSLSIPAAVHRVVTPQINADKATMTFRVWVFADAKAATDPASNLLDELTRTFTDVPYEMDGENPFKQAYAHLKGLPDYSEAADMIEVK